MCGVPTPPFIRYTKYGYNCSLVAFGKHVEYGFFITLMFCFTSNHIADFTFLNALAIEIKLGVVWTFAKIKPVKYHESWYILYLITHQATMKLGYINGIRYQL